MPIECYGYAGMFGLICVILGAMAVIVVQHFTSGD